MATRYVYRSSVSGYFVSRAYAEKYPDTTYRIPVKPKKKGKRA